ncbi:MAG TPA: hypothetical protein VMU02_03410 [bacterium]|nr:hypothetical protein [bacterium]
MSHLKHATRSGGHLSQTIPGYKGYSGSKVAQRTDRIFSEDILSKLSEAVATSSRIRRHAGISLDADMISSLATIEEKAENLAQMVAETAFDEGAGSPEHGMSGQVVSLDSSILEKIGSVNQALSTMDLEGGTGVTGDDLDSISDLLDDLKNLIKRRGTILNSK